MSIVQRITDATLKPYHYDGPDGVHRMLTDFRTLLDEAARLERVERRNEVDLRVLRETIADLMRRLNSALVVICRVELQVYQLQKNGDVVAADKILHALHPVKVPPEEERIRQALERGWDEGSHAHANYWPGDDSLRNPHRDGPLPTYGPISEVLAAMEKQERIARRGTST